MNPSDQFVLFALPERTCALPRPAVRELLPLPQLWQPPGTPDMLAGFLNLGGSAIPVIWLARMFALPTPQVPPLYAHILMLAQPAGRPLGLLVERVLDVVTFAADQVLPVDADASLNGCVQGEIRWQGGLVHLLSADRILLAEENRRLAALSEQAQQRLSDWAAAV